MQNVSRRNVLQVLVGGGVASAVTTLLAACGGSTASTSASTSTSSIASRRATTTSATVTAATSTAKSVSSSIASSTTSSASAPSKTVSLKWVTNHSAPRVKLFDNLATQFEQAHPGYKVTVQNVTGGNYDTTVISTWAASGTLPDVFYNRTFYTAFRAYKGWTVPLNSYIARDHLAITDFRASEMHNCTWQGKVQSLPYDWSVFAIFYNIDMFKAMGVDLPPADGNWTWQDLLARAQKLSKAENGRQVQWGYAGQPNDWTLFGPLEANGGQIFTADLKKCIINNAANQQTLQFFADLVHKWHVSPGPGDISKTVQDPFASGLVAMEYQGSWAVLLERSLIGKRFNWDVALLPKGSTGKLPTTGAGGAWSIGVNSKDKGGAWQLLKFITSEKADSYLVSQQVGSLPGNTLSMKTYLSAVQQSNTPPHNAAIFNKEGNEAFPVPNIPYYNQFITTLDQKVGAIYAGQPVQQMLQQLEETVNGFIPQYKF